MSRFFRGDSESDESDSDSSGSEGGVNTPVVPQKQPTRLRGQSDSDSDDEPTKRVVKSQATKMSDELGGLLDQTREHIKENEWGLIEKDLDKLIRAVQKYNVTAKPPPAFLKGVISIENAITKLTEDKTLLKAVSGPNLKVYNAFSKKIKKTVAPFQDSVAAFRKSNPNISESEEEEDEEDELSEEEKAPAKPAAKVAAKKPAAPAAAATSTAPSGPKYGAAFFKKAAGAKDESDSEDDSGLGSDDEEDSEDESSSSGDDKPQPQRGPNRWLLSESSKKPAAPAPAPTRKKPAARPQTVESSSSEGDDEEGSEDEKEKAPAKSDKPVPVKEMNAEEVDKKLAELLALRGKKGTDRLDQIEQLTQLSQHAKSDAQLTSILMHLVSAQFDATPSMTTYMPAAMWRSTAANINRILSILNRNSSFVLAESEDDHSESEESVLIVGNLLAYVERLDDEYVKGLQNIDDPHTHEYVQRLQDEPAFIELATAVQAYYERVGHPDRATRVAARRLEHLYYKHDKDIQALAKAASAKQATDGSSAPAPESFDNLSNYDLIHNLAIKIYSTSDDRMRARAMLQHIYHHALHDRYYEARDMILMSHLQESVGLMDVPTQILFNRAMVQIGLCAFRLNLIAEAHSCLTDICGGGRVKELLAQGVTSTRYAQDKNLDQEKLEKKRMVPFHMHIHLDLLECVHLICAMLLEVPNIAANPYDSKKRLISKTFRRMMDYFDRQVFTGPPENNRDFIAAAAKALFQGNWKQTVELVNSLKVWALVPNADAVKNNLRKRIQEEGLRTYMFTYGSFYDTLNLKDIADMFELPKNAVHSLLSKMMINEELKASWDQPAGAIIMHKTDPSKLQYLALQFSEKIAVFVDNNERTLYAKTGENFAGTGKYEGDQKSGGRGGQSRDNRQGYSEWRGQGGQGRSYDNRNKQYGDRQRQDGGRGQQDKRSYNDNRNRNTGGDNEFQSVSGRRKNQQ